MPEKVYAQIDISQATFTLQASGPSSNYNSFHYVSVLDENYQLTELREGLQSKLKKSNIRVNDKKTAEYLITIESIAIRESFFDTGTYTDTCQCPNKEIELPLNTLTYTVDVSIFNIQRKVHLHSFTKSFLSKERISDCACGENVKSLIDVSAMREELAECIRDEIANIVFVDKGF